MAAHTMEEFSQAQLVAVNCTLKKKRALWNIDLSTGTLYEQFAGGTPAAVPVQAVYRHRAEPRLRIHTTVKGKAKELEYGFADTKDSEAAFIALQAALREETTRGFAPVPVSVFVGSMNMGDAGCDDDLEPWIPRNMFDVYAIGVQECEYKPAGGGKCETHWFGQIREHLGEGYVQISGGSLWSIRIIVFVRAELRELVSGTQITSEATGIGHVAGNKGGIGVSFNLGDTSFFFLTSHLAAHQGEVAKRNSDFAEIVQGLSKLSVRNVDVTSLYDHVFWFGDLNYRIDLERDAVLGLIDDGDWDALLAADQLKAEMAAGRVFAGFEEAEINFRPTYKYEPGTRNYDTKKMRVPSYTDRILWRTAPHVEMSCTSFEPADAIMTSDHSPVSATFETEILHTYVPAEWDDALDARGVVRIRNLVGENLRSMDLNGYSDPYIVFFGRGITTVQTPTIKKNLNPVWADDADAPFDAKLTVNQPAYVERQSIIALVMDEDKVSKDDPIGQAWIPLAPALNSDGPWEFHVELTANGLPAGLLSGTIEVDLDAL